MLVGPPSPHALRQLPITIADNAGYDSSQLVSELRAEHMAGHSTMGLDMDKGGVEFGDESRRSSSPPPRLPR